MFDTNKIIILSESYQNEDTNELVQGLTIMIDGKLKQVMDVIISKDNRYDSYVEIVKDSLISGLDSIIRNI
jgi:translation elongation factor P/translation initiation factor 5A